RAERAMRREIAAVPDGTYRYAFETDGADAPLHFAVAVAIAGDEVVADYTGTSPAQPRAINCVLAYTFAMTAYAIRCALLPTLPNNEGMYRPVRVPAPQDSIFNPPFPPALVNPPLPRPHLP